MKSLIFSSCSWTENFFSRVIFWFTSCLEYLFSLFHDKVWNFSLLRSVVSRENKFSSITNLTAFFIWFSGKFLLLVYRCLSLDIITATTFKYIIQLKKLWTSFVAQWLLSYYGPKCNSINKAKELAHYKLFLIKVRN